MKEKSKERKKFLKPKPEQSKQFKISICELHSNIK